MPTEESLPQDGDYGPPRRGGHDPLARQVMFKLEVSGRLRTGHTTDYSDPDAPVVIREADDLYPGAAYAEGRCRRCIAKPYLVTDEAETIMVLEHEDRCPFMAALLREAEAVNAAPLFRPGSPPRDGEVD